jgi:hypothetical protein
MNSKICIYDAQARHLNYIGVLMIYMSDRYKKCLPAAPSGVLKDET